MMAALVVAHERQQDDRTTRPGSLDFVLLLVWWVYLYLFTVTPWSVYPNELAYQQNLNTIYLAEKLVFLAALTVVWTRSSPSWKTIYGQLFGASLISSLSSYWAIRAVQNYVHATATL